VSRVAVIDNKLCNLDSISRAIETCGASAVKTSDPADLADADLLVLPGVGNFGPAMDNLNGFGLSEAIHREVARGKPLLGICLGMQLLARSSEEAPGQRGLSLIDGEVELLRREPGERIPHIGWNSVDQKAAEPVLAGIPTGADFYFVHSYHLRCFDPAQVVAVTQYGGGFTSVVRKGNIVGCQFHPEKSQNWGFVLLKNYLGSISSASERARPLTAPGIQTPRNAQNTRPSYASAPRRWAR
jgi:glutamine amidotransferase